MNYVLATVGWVSDSVTQQSNVNPDTNVGLRDKAANPTYDNAKTEADPNATYLSLTKKLKKDQQNV